MKKRVFNNGINDANYSVNYTVNGKKTTCPYYSKWYEMIRRCYSVRYHLTQPSYITASVCEEWLIFSNFKAWMETQDWEGKQLDKDLLVEGNREYSPSSCCFISQKLNCFIKDTYHDLEGRYRGVSFYKQLNKYQAQCSDPFTGKRGCCGYFDDPYMAHLAWKARKQLHAKELAALETDERIIKALLERFM
jgi:hypothetical protein